MYKYKLLTFNTTHNAMLSEKILKESGYAIRLIPVPRSISASCGLAARVLTGDYKTAVEIIKEQGIDLAGIYDF